MNPPKRIQYRGSTYTLRTAAQPKLTPEEEKKRRENPFRRTRPTDPSQDAPVTEDPEKKPVLEDPSIESLEDVERAAREQEAAQEPEAVEIPSDVMEITSALFQALTDESKKYMKETGIQASISDNEIEWTPEKDGLDLTFELDAGNFSAIPDSSVTFDYKITLELPEEARLTPEGEEAPPAPAKEASVKKDAAFWSDFVAVIQAGEVVGKKKLQEVVFRFCSRNFVSPANDAGPLLTAVNVFQDKEKTSVEAGPLAREAILDILNAASEEEKDTKTAELTTKVLNELIAQNVGKKTMQSWDSRSWKSSGKVVELLEKLKTVKSTIPEDTADIVIDFINKLGADGWLEFYTKSQAEGDPGKTALTEEEIEKAVRALTAHEGYKGKVQSGADEKVAVASIRAPYKTIYLFDKRPGSPTPVFQQMRVRLCNHTWVAKDPKNAALLLSAQLDLAEAAKRTVNPSFSEEAGDPATKEQLLQMVSDQLGVERGSPEPAAQSAPAEKEAPPSPGDVKAAQYYIVPEYPY